jgi:D-beta-D-heptose 7-phosphate kinase/D-beta-D-heptose 1-phosphate adenosyltransferase
MGQIVNLEEIKTLAENFHNQNKQIVLAGGCFDLLHIGHITFLEKAKQEGDVLIIMLESDESITQTKGSNRPINTQTDRARILAALSTVDVVLLLSPRMTNTHYDTLVFAIKPAIIATTKGDDNRHFKEKQAEKVGAHVIDVTLPISDKSTTKLVNLLNEL